ncbi:MAG: nucleoside-diphosphate kinase [Bacilli bacterium]
MQQRTFILVKPDAIERHLGEEILDQLRANGLVVLRMKKVLATKEQILAHYRDVIDRLKLDYIEKAILDEFENKLVWIIVATHPKGNPIQTVRTMIGPTDPAKAEDFTIRGQFGRDTMELSMKEHRLLKNPIHASDSEEAVNREIRIWFGE